MVNWARVRRPRALGMFERETFRPEIGHHLAAGKQFVSPRIGGPFQPTARCKLQLDLSRQALSCPKCICERIAVSDMDHRMIVGGNGTIFRPIWRSPVCARNIVPPAFRTKRLPLWRRGKDNRSSNNHFGQNTGIVSRVRNGLGQRNIAGIFDKCGELGISNRRGIQKERLYCGLLNRRFLGIKVSSADGECTTIHLYHAAQRFCRWHP